MSVWWMETSDDHFFQFIDRDSLPELIIRSTSSVHKINFLHSLRHLAIPFLLAWLSGSHLLLARIFSHERSHDYFICQPNILLGNSQNRELQKYFWNVTVL